jgi:hypothetical protein
LVLARKREVARPEGAAPKKSPAHEVARPRGCSALGLGGKNQARW